MKKTERVNLIMRYINNRAQFTIAEIQREFEISRSTAIRDIEEIQALGFPLTTELGRGGGYFVMQNEYLPAVRFTPDELKAIVISFIASKNSQLPYLQNRKSIMEKLIGIASQTQQDELIELEKILLFENANPGNPSILELDDYASDELNQLISLVVKDRYLQVTYELHQGWSQLMEIYVLHILYDNSQWIMEVYDFASEKMLFLPIDMLRNSRLAEGNCPLNEDEVLAKRVLFNRQSNLMVRLDATGIRRFKRIHPPEIILSFTGMFQTSGTFAVHIDEKNEEQLDYYMDWLMFLGEGVEFEKIPQTLKKKL
ncbi:MAG: HTH domain-containing protein, partial [Streptococcaceae bacterium]|nr:HTH domain-containing protein [Streptococcaceae bacterium]MCL2681593.1 HTH domain-containing protein [Streptococcaceae bacterium]